MQRPLRVLAFAGSTRGASFNRALVGIAAAAAREAGAAVTEIDLRDYRLPVFDADDESERGKPEPARALKQQLIDHDAWLIAAPEHNSSITAVLKNSIDWASRPDPDDGGPLAAFRGKLIVLMSASPGVLGGLRGLVHVRAILGNLGCVVLPDQVAVPRAHEAFDADGRLIDPQQHQRIQGLGRTLVAHGTKLFG
jgi:NAD(P)H-dependent FMN reductase